MRTLTVWMIVAVGLVGCGTPDVSTGGEPQSDVVEPDSDEVAADPADEEPEPELHAEREELEVVDYGFSTFDVSYDDSTRASWAVVLENPNASPHVASSIDVTVTLLDAEGSVAASSSHSVPLLLPGQQAAVSGSRYDDVGEVAEMRVQTRARQWEREDGPFGEFTTSDVNVRADNYSGWRVTGQVTSTFTRDFADVYGTAVLRNEQGAIVGGAFTFIDFVPADGDTSFQIDIMDDIANVASADVHVTLSNLSMF